MREIRVDIYVDSCQVHPGKENPAVASGWGAVAVINSPYEELRFSGFLEQGEVHFEEMGIKVALNEIAYQLCSREFAGNPKFILHTDMEPLADKWKKVKRDNKGNVIYGGRINPETLQTLLKFGIAEIEFTSDPKPDHKSWQYRTALKSTDSPHMTTADNMASAQAWQKRLEMQGYVHMGRRLTGDEAVAQIMSRYNISEQVISL